MSTNSECVFIERKPGQWYYVLEDSHAPKNAWDWMEYASAYGAFPSYEVAWKHLHDNHANPGGHGKTDYEEHSKGEERPILKQLLDNATSKENPFTIRNTDVLMRMFNGMSLEEALKGKKR